MIGRVLSHYRILDKIDAGGMGVVYKAEDTRLGRVVALKVLSEELALDRTAIERFRREARAASALNHPNICTIHDIDEVDGAPFFVMELLDGQTLRDLLKHGAIPHDRLIELAIEFADALAAAHEAGIVHRDLKPANLFVTRLGHLKILDFGLAKLVAAVSEDSEAATEQHGLTAGDTTLGTIGYMSPEQTRGDVLDARSDLFSFGAVLYEMASGTRPFSGPTSAATSDAILHHNPPPPARQPALDAIILKALEKDRELRYQSAADIRADLKRLRRETSSGELVAAKRPRSLALPILAVVLVGVLTLGVFVWRRRNAPPPASVSRQTVIAVLPFSNLDHDRSRDYLRYALPDEVITLLSYSPSLAVRPFAMTRKFGDDADPQQTGRALKVSNILTGHFTTVSGRLGVTLEAIDVEKNEVSWRDTIDGPVNDLIAMREQIASRIRAGLLPRLNATSEPARNNRPTSDEAYDLYLRAAAASSDPVPNAQALAMLERAVKLDPNYAPAWSALANRYYFMGQGETDDPKRDIAKAEAATRRALQLDPNLLNAIRRLIVLRTEGGDLHGAYRDAMDLLNRYPQSAHAHFAVAYVLRYAGLYNESARECELARAIDPTDSSIRSCALTYLELGDTERARQYLRLDEGSAWASTSMVIVLLREHRFDEAIAYGRSRPILAYAWWPVLDGYASHVAPGELQRRAAEARQLILKVPDGEPQYYSSETFAMVGQRTDALETLRHAVERSYCSYPALDTNPLFDSIRHDPEFQKIRTMAMDCQARFVRFRAQLR